MNANSAFNGIPLSEMGMDYPLEWLDRLVNESLNPENVNVGSTEPTMVFAIIDYIKEEDVKLQLLIKSQTFGLNEEEAAMLIRRYHSSLIKLLDQSLENHRNLVEQSTPLLDLYQALTECLDNLLAFIETWFSAYLTLDERVPPSYLKVTKEELSRKLKKINANIDQYKQTSPILRLVVKRLNRFINAETYRFEVTFRAVFYKKRLVSKIEELNWELPSPEFCISLHELLIYMNFNSKSYIKLLTGELHKMIYSSETDFEKLNKLLLYYKAFSQLHCRPDTILNPKYHDVETILKNWYEQEISYLEKKMLMQTGPVEQKSKAQEKGDSQVVIKHKLTCGVSTDQMALFLRSAFDSELLVAASLNQVFKIVVEHLSTIRKENLSYEAVRNKSYMAEEKDKQIALDFLEKMKEHIRGY